MKNCTECKYAEWKETATGRLHPSGDGRCKYPFKVPELPSGACKGSLQTPPRDRTGGYEMIDINELRRKVNSTDVVDHTDLHANIRPIISEFLDRLEAAESARRDDYQNWMTALDRNAELLAERDALREALKDANDEVVFIDGVGAGRSSIKSCRDGVQWVVVGDRVYWPLSDSDAKRLQSACCGNGHFDGPATPTSEGEQQ